MRVSACGLALAALLLTSVAVADEPEPPKPPMSPEQTSQLARMLDEDWENRPPWAEMAVMILKGDPMGSGQGWFTGSQRRHDWQWLAEQFPDRAEDGRITRDEISALSDEQFARVDQDRDGALTPADFAFEKNPFMEDASGAGAIFSRLDADSNGRLTSDEIQHWFDKASEESDYLSVSDLKVALGLGPRPPRRGSRSGGPPVDPRWKMMSMFLDGEMGSFSEGPNLNDDAPELDLPLVERTAEGVELKLTDRRVKLEDSKGKKPVVLIFGSFT